MKLFKVGDIVRAYDGSGVIGLDADNRLELDLSGTNIIERDFEVIMIDCGLSAMHFLGAKFSDTRVNDLILRATDNGQVIFITSTQVKLKHRCNSCPSCGQQL